ncbi:E3 ubiquitin-protein ligase MARCH11 isoform X3 [Rhinatrema bivittatum]|uniref:E3 ubiquitin-protein ligase MARCH11 isoform X3 n=1 Tax=Rhinatrema bivittatum TaxID=194408 RepID=UPI00112CB8ED|nr:E3 ubiquitin-protein ligase MARCH11 isoform X3 [Rhinatrema bivittatum]
MTSEESAGTTAAAAAAALYQQLPVERAGAAAVPLLGEGEEEEEPDEEEPPAPVAAVATPAREGAGEGGSGIPQAKPHTGRAPKADAESVCSSDNSSPTPICKICFQGAEQGELLNPCRCDGSVRYTHQLCLLKWISERGSWTCELCCYRYHVIAIKMKKPCQKTKWRLGDSFVQKETNGEYQSETWQSITVTLVEKVQMIAVILGSLFLISSVTWLLWSAFSPSAVWQRKDILFQICYGMYGFMDLVCIAQLLHQLFS